MNCIHVLQSTKLSIKLKFTSQSKFYVFQCSLHTITFSPSLHMFKCNKQANGYKTHNHFILNILFSPFNFCISLGGGGVWLFPYFIFPSPTFREPLLPQPFAASAAVTSVRSHCYSRHEPLFAPFPAAREPWFPQSELPPLFEPSPLAPALLQLH